MASYVRVFVSYSHDSAEHQDRVLALAERLRADGVDVHLDQYETAPSQGWPQWMLDQIEEAEFVLVVCTETYHQRFRGKAPAGSGRGVKWEGAVLTQTLYDGDSRNQRFIPVLLNAADEAHIPVVLRGTTWYLATSEGGYEHLYRHLTNQPAVVKGKLGERKHLGPRQLPQGEAPKYESDEIRGWSQELKAAFQRKKELLSRGGDTRAIQETILGLQRRLRQGPQLKAGDLLDHGRFELMQLIGQGGFATVWKAWDEQRGELVAVKVLHGQYAADRSRCERFFAGAQTMADLNHPGIVRVLETRKEDGGHPFFVMEYLPGGDLQQAVLAGRLTVKQRLEAIVRVGEALEFAHEKGVIHRDVKPHNILLDAQANPRLTDFDLARAVDESLGTRTGTVLGTAIYAAPELLERPQDAGPAADVYGLGMTLLFALQGSNLTLAAFRNADSFVAKLDVPEELKVTLRRAVAWEIEDRWPRAQEFVAALRGCQLVPRPAPPTPPTIPSQAAPEQEEAHVPPAPAPPRSANGKRQRPEPAWKAWLAVALVLLLVVVVGYQLVPETSDPPPPVIPSPLPKNPQPGDPWIDPAIGMRFHYIPAGTFQMGSPEDEPDRLDREGPRHEVTLLRGYWLGETEVTQGQWRRLMGNNPSRFQECGDDCPVEQVNWYESVAFANALSRRAGLSECYELRGCQGEAGKGMRCAEGVFKGLGCSGYRLPTEAEWERAARAGTETALYTGSITIVENESAQLDPIAWYGANSGGRPHPVGQKQANAWQLKDMLGNVWEWCGDWGGTYSATALRDPQGPATGSFRVVRGGSWSYQAQLVRAACRIWYEPGLRYDDLGFRLARGQGPSQSGEEGRSP